MSRFPRALPLVAIAAVLLAVSFSGGAVAAKMITGKQIKDNTVTTKDVKDRTLTVNDLSPAAIAALQSGATDPQGAPGPAGVSELERGDRDLFGSQEDRGYHGPLPEQLSADVNHVRRQQLRRWRSPRTPRGPATRS